MFKLRKQALKSTNLSSKFTQQLVFTYLRSNFRMIECEELHDILVEGNKPGFKILHPYLSDNRANYLREVTNFLVHGHIKGAFFINMHDISDLTSSYKMMAPTNEQFSIYMQHADIGKFDKLVIYDETIMVSTRLHWQLNSFGHTNLYYLNGGLRRWKYLGLPLEKGFTQHSTNISEREAKNFEYILDKSKVIDYNEMCKVNNEYLQQNEFQIYDSRRVVQYSEGTEPNWIHIPVMQELIQEDGRFKDINDLQKIHKQYKVDYDKTIIHTCRRGLQATVANFACELVCAANKKNYNSRIYDGSWEEWMTKKQVH
ncbi:rhodanese-like domain protein (macronuclear) [Tetrahymena thermophila SB210]|uniref:Rhodanese-like domain protein n=1 Tax=Tetrahymena thermophila (strain SB210) TaxID=312017 RepID=Q24IJ7_TETTS|nr:rhodanese-like domain protein [Tetrahymena thermophila SB210]EAS07628.2 rhodanese-like domain protein [Tetrahymena thermophila SB210]|eukprot:XP_001027870.2 rhodanese-like domain protein [Tetrahymena thermophila SB210]